MFRKLKRTHFDIQYFIHKESFAPFRTISVQSVNSKQFGDVVFSPIALQFCFINFDFTCFRMYPLFRFGKLYCQFHELQLPRCRWAVNIRPRNQSSVDE